MKEITQDERSQFTERYKEKSANGTLVTKTDYKKDGQTVTDEILGYGFDAVEIFTKGVDNGADKIFVEFGAHDDGKICLVLSLMKDGFVVTSYEWSEPCPPFCG